MVQVTEAEKNRLAEEGVKFCVVDGQGSHRENWEKRTSIGGVEYVACDHHSDEEFNDAIAVAERNRSNKANALGGSKLVSESAKMPAARSTSSLGQDQQKPGGSKLVSGPTGATPGTSSGLTSQAAKPPDSGTAPRVANATPSTSSTAQPIGPASPGTAGGTGASPATSGARTGTSGTTAKQEDAAAKQEETNRAAETKSPEEKKPAA